MKVRSHGCCRGRAAPSPKLKVPSSISAICQLFQGSDAAADVQLKDQRSKLYLCYLSTFPRVGCCRRRATQRSKIQALFLLSAHCYLSTFFQGSAAAADVRLKALRSKIQALFLLSVNFFQGSVAAADVRPQAPSSKFQALSLLSVNFLLPLLLSSYFPLLTSYSPSSRIR